MVNKTGKMILGIFSLAVMASVIYGYSYYTGTPISIPYFGLTAFEGCTWDPILCYATCQVNRYKSPTQTLTGGFGAIDRTQYAPFNCPQTADTAFCIIDSWGSEQQGVERKATVYRICQIETAWYGSYWQCYDPIKTFTYPETGSTTKSGAWFGRGQWIMSDLYKRIQIKVWKQELRRCGEAACPEGSGDPIVGADGCSWNPSIENYEWSDGSKEAREIPLGESRPFVCAQRLTSCPQTCEPGVDDIKCSVPVASLKTFTIEYNGRIYNAYVSNAMTRIVGCKVATQHGCVEYDEGTGKCLKEGDVEQGQCGTIATWSVGQCALNSDCLRTDYYCDFSTETGTGVCRPYDVADPPECRYDYDCWQTDAGCFNRQIKQYKCVNEKCEHVVTNVECCYNPDCQSGYYCDVDHKCRQSQAVKDDCPYQCCMNENLYYDKPCTETGKTYCCPDHTCAVDESHCGVVSTTTTTLPQGAIAPAPTDWILWLVIGLSAILAVSGIARTYLKMKVRRY